MKKNIIYGLFLALAFLLSSASFASPYSNESGIEPATDHMFVLAAWPPLVPAVKNTAYDTFTAMAGGSGNDIEKDKYCMACRSDERTSVGINLFQVKVTDNRIPRTMLACGYSDITKDKPYKVPISKAV